MYTQTIPSNTSNTQVAISPNRPVSPHWTLFFSRKDAAQTLFDKVATLGSYSTEEKNTLESYTRSLHKFNVFAGDNLPSAPLMQRYINYLRNHEGLKTASIITYLAPIRTYLRALVSQPTIGWRGDDHAVLSEYREQIRNAIDVKNPSSPTKSNYGPLFNPEFVRLEQNQVNLVLLKIDRYSLQGKRDYALLMTAFYTALRITELTRITLKNITATDFGYQVTVRGKRGVTDPVPLSKFAYNAIMEYVNAYNDAVRTAILKADLETDKSLYATIPPAIEGDVPLWQPLEGEVALMRVGRGIGTGFYDPCVGLLQKGIRGIIGNRTAHALGEEFRLAAHDTRRTAAYIAYKAGMPLPAIQKLLRHKRPEITWRYIGESPDLAKSDFGAYGVVFGYA